MTETNEATNTAVDDAPAKSTSRKKSGGLNSLLLPELKRIASGLGIKGSGTMRKSALVDAITAAQGGSAQTAGRSSSGSDSRARSESSSDGDRGPSSAGQATSPETARVRPDEQPSAQPSDDTRRDRGAEQARDGGRSRERNQGREGHKRDRDTAQTSRDSTDNGRDSRDTPQNGRDTAQSGREIAQARDGRDNQSRDGRDNGQSRDNGRDNQSRDGRDNGQTRDRDTQSRDSRDNGQNRDGGQGRDRDTQNRDGGQGRDSYRDDDRGGTSRNSRRRNRNRDRYRDRDQPQGGRDRERSDPEPQVSDDDVLIPVAGILDLLDNYAFVRTSGYLPGPNDVYVALSMVRKYGLRKGDAITGEVRQGQGDRREKFNPLVRIDTVNGTEPEASRSRVEFSKLTPLYAADRLRLETEPTLVTTRLIDIVAPIGKGQRGLIVSPSKAGKTLVMQAIANAITTNNPECHLMVVLVDERPEEVTDMQRAVKGEVIASTFDRPAEDHTTVAELAIERAKRLVELGHDVVVLLDSITRLGRAYNLAAPASGRILSGGVDSSALYPPKRFFGAARNIEDGGSLTILATALIETGSKMDEVIFEEFKGTGNMELRLRREYADKRIFPAIDVDASGTRREELLMSKDELQVVWKLRRVLSALDGQQALELLLEKLKQTKSNIEFLMQVNKTTPTPAGLRGQDEG